MCASPVAQQGAAVLKGVNTNSVADPTSAQAVHACNTCRRSLSPLLVLYHVSLFQLNPHQHKLKSKPYMLPADKLWL